MQSGFLTKHELTVITYNTACIERGIKIWNKLIFKTNLYSAETFIFNLHNQGTFPKLSFLNCHGKLWNWLRIIYSSNLVILCLTLKEVSNNITAIKQTQYFKWYLTKAHIILVANLHFFIHNLLSSTYPYQGQNNYHDWPD